ncbi:prolipoprotein diacylglyceryl transferase [Marihabitans asiaticum]|uniref:Phosphatidylglycerol--prolipoprotein diacylglyceryl transferase n=1 Tax=Marihabitans asiaticum TaxID=415218 RepID=A0A560WAS1_9MICO|nr:prolipoprotein diacylglyceryl transferase [Marihabitans asiaticum]TWD14729.1 prolipoprotein diacylglyceryl transferase [Marihabitans asiaticum]
MSLGLAPATLPSPEVAALSLGPITLHAYALCILAGIMAAVWITQRRLSARGGQDGVVVDIALWAVPAGIIGARIYHVITTPDPYFGPQGELVDALKIWNGGLGIWGAVAGGAIGAWIACRRYDVPFLTLGTAIAPALPVAQAVGRWGNWFNNELYGGPTDLPWALEIHRWDAGAGRAVTDASGQAEVLGTFHPVFLYESLFCLVLAVLLLLLERRLPDLAPGQLFGAYVAGYPVGRVFLELMRTDEAEVVLGQRLNVWTSLVVMGLGVLIWVACGRRRASSTKDAADEGGDSGRLTMRDQRVTR